MPVPTDIEAKLVALDRLLTERHAATERAFDLRLEAIQRSIDLEHGDISKRIDLMVARIDVLQADHGNYLPREIFGEFQNEYRRRHEALIERINAIDFVDMRTFETTVREWSSWRDSVNERLQGISGRDRGVALAWGVGVAVLGIIIAIAGTAIGFITWLLS